MTPASNKKVWWRCERGHEWKTDIATRTLQGTGCPRCSNQSSKNEIRIFTELQALFQEVESRHRIDGLEVDVYLPSLSIAIEYDGKYWHENKEVKDRAKQAVIEEKGITLVRVREAPLSPLSNTDIVVPAACLLKKQHLNALVSQLGLEGDIVERYISEPNFFNEETYLKYLDYFPSPFPQKSLALINPAMAAEWHRTKNGPLTPSNFTPGSDHVASWQCEKGHEWEAAISSRNFFNSRCPYCVGKKATPENCMATTRPDMASVWHTTKNGNATPHNTKAGSGIKRWWNCLENPEHEWRRAPDKLQHLSLDNFCPHCRIERNPPLAITHPEIARMWHPKKNGDATPNDIARGSSRRRWWICPENPEHEWQNSPCNITKSGRRLGYCPFCSERRRLES